MAEEADCNLQIQGNRRVAQQCSIQEPLVESTAPEVPFPGGMLVLGAHLLGMLTTRLLRNLLLADDVPHRHINWGVL